MGVWCQDMCTVCTSAESMASAALAPVMVFNLHSSDMWHVMQDFTVQV